MPNRRWVVAALGALAAGAAPAHTPYGQWVVYRQKHLLVGAHRGDARTYELAQAVVAALAVELPEAQARVARGPRPQRIASLMGTGQLMLAVLKGAEARRMARAAPPFEGYRPVPLRAMASLADGYGLWAAPEMPDDHARLVAGALDHAGAGAPPDRGALPLHPGAAAIWAGR